MQCSRQHLKVNTIEGIIKQVWFTSYKWFTSNKWLLNEQNHVEEKCWIKSLLYWSSEYGKKLDFGAIFFIAVRSCSLQINMLTSYYHQEKKLLKTLSTFYCSANSVNAARSLMIVTDFSRSHGPSRFWTSISCSLPQNKFGFENYLNYPVKSVFWHIKLFLL